jgi:hypothetical protein
MHKITDDTWLLTQKFAMIIMATVTMIILIVENHTRNTVMSMYQSQQKKS